MSELTSAPMAYAVRPDDKHVTVFSNYERVRLWQDIGEGYVELETRNPETSFAVGQAKFPFALHHPPFQFVVATIALGLKAEGMISNVVQAVAEWRLSGKAVKLILDADRSEIIADGGDLSRIVVTAADANGTTVETCDTAVNFDIVGMGQLVGENPVKLKAGKMAILVQSGFVADKLVVTAKADGLQDGKTVISTKPVSADVDMPMELPVKLPTKRNCAP